MGFCTVYIIHVLGILNERFWNQIKLIKCPLNQMMKYYDFRIYDRVEKNFMAYEAFEKLDDNLLFQNNN